MSYCYSPLFPLTLKERNCKCLRLYKFCHRMIILFYSTIVIFPQLLDSFHWCVLYINILFIYTFIVYSFTLHLLSLWPSHLVFLPFFQMVPIILSHHSHCRLQFPVDDIYILWLNKTPLCTFSLSIHPLQALRLFQWCCY